MYYATSASDSTAIGNSALQNSTTNGNNTAVGKHAGINLTGTYNTAVGSYTLRGANGSTGSNNVAVGSYSLDNALTSGSYNVALGHDTARNITSGGNNVCLGHSAGHSNSPSGQITTGSNSVVLGNNSIQNIYCADTSISSSDKRDKTDIADFTHGLNWINQLKPVMYRWDKRTWYDNNTPDGSKKRNKKHIGFLAQDVLAIEGNPTDKDDMLIVNLNEDNTAYGLKYERLVPVLVNAIKELSAKITTLENK